MLLQSHSGLFPSSEDEILSSIARHFPNKHPSVALCRGDDCALFHVEHSMAVSSDLFLENTHFRKTYFSPADIGHKALAVNLSDLAACGARPVGFTLNLGLPEDITMEWLDELFAGMASLAMKNSIALVGGDLSKAEQISISITVFGEISGVSCFLTRGGSMPGDMLFCIGQLGLARVGLHVLERFGREAIKNWPKACAAHLHPEPHCNAGQVLGRIGYSARPPALMDVSDGLVRDLPRLLGLSGELGLQQNDIATLGAELTISEDMLQEEVRKWSHDQHENPLCTALLGGEDYALLGSCAPDLLPTLEAAIPEFVCIGNVTGDGKIHCQHFEFSAFEGFDHFSGYNMRRDH